MRNIRGINSILLLKYLANLDYRGSMAKKPTQPSIDPNDELDPAEAQRRMDDAVRRMLSTKPETHEEMVERKHRKGEIKPRRK